MLKLFVYLLSFLIVTLPLQSNSLSAQEKEKLRVAIVDFEGKGITKDEADALTGRFRSVLVSTNKFIVVERNKVNLILEEVRLQMTGVVSDESIVEAGKLLGVERIITGGIGKIGDTYTVDLNVIEVETGKVIGTISRNVSGTKENLLALLENLAKRLAGIKVDIKKFNIKIFSKPGNSSVYLDGKYIGLSPIEKEIEEGQHYFKIKHDGYKEWTGKIMVSKSDKIIAKLEKKASKAKTWLWIGAGTLVAGGGILAAVLLSGDESSEKEQPIGTPPNPPSN